MSLPPSPGDPYPYHPRHPPPRRGLNLGVGALLGVLVGILGPIVLSLIAYTAGQGFSGGLADDIVGLSLLAIFGLPVLLLVAGCVLMIPDRLRGWGVAALMASGIWLISSAGVCVVALFVALDSYEASGMMLL